MTLQTSLCAFGTAVAIDPVLPTTTLLKVPHQFSTTGQVVVDNPAQNAAPVPTDKLWPKVPHQFSANPLVVIPTNYGSPPTLQQYWG